MVSCLIKIQWRLLFLPGFELFNTLFKLSEAFGALTIRVEAAGDFVGAMQTALAEKNRPSVVIVPVDYRENIKLTRRLGELHRRAG